MLATGGHSWSQVVTPGHRWSHLVTGGHTWSHWSLSSPSRQNTIQAKKRKKTLYTKEFEFPALFTPHALAVSRHPCHAKTLFSPSPPRQNTFRAIPDTPKHYSRHSQNTLYTEKFEFPALFSAVHWPIGPVPEINVNWYGPVLHTQFSDRSGIRGRTSSHRYRQTTDRQTAVRSPLHGYLSCMLQLGAVLITSVYFQYLRPPRCARGADNLPP